MTNIILERVIPHCEVLMNRRMRDSVSAREACEALSGKVLEIEITDLEQTILLAPIGDEIEILLASDLSVDVTFSGSSFTFLKATQQKPLELVRAGELKMKGDMVLASQFQQLLDLAMPDWQEEIAKIFGDYVGPQINAAVDVFANIGKRFMQGFTQANDESETSQPGSANVIEGLKAVGEEVQKGIQDLSERMK